MLLEALLAHHAIQAEYLAQNDAGIDDNRLHLVVLRLQADVSVLLVESLDGGRIVDECNYNLAVLCSLAAVDEYEVAIVDTNIDHGIAVYLEDKRIPCGNVLRRYWEIALNVLLCKDGLTGRNLPDNRERCRVGANHIKSIVADLNSTGLGGIAADIAILLQRLQMRMNG